MRRYLLVLPFLIACGGAETPPADSAAAAPAALTDADVAGTWTGTLMAEGSDSVLANWTDICAAGTCKLVASNAPNDTITSTYTIQADSVVGMSAAYADPTVGGAMVTDHWVARVAGNQITGTGQFRLAATPDSVLMRYRFTGTKQP
jgi:hypothetical protein